MKRALLIVTLLGLIPISGSGCKRLVITEEPAGAQHIYCVHYYETASIEYLQNCTATEASEQATKSCLLAGAESWPHDVRRLGVYLSDGQCPRREPYEFPAPDINIDKPLPPVNDPGRVNAAIGSVFCVNPDYENGYNRVNCYTVARGHGAEDCAAFADSLGLFSATPPPGYRRTLVPILAGACPTRPRGMRPDSFLVNPDAGVRSEPRRQFCMHHTDGRCGYCFILSEGGESLTGADCRVSSEDIDDVWEGECTFRNDCSSDDVLPPVMLPALPRLRTDRYCLLYTDDRCITCSETFPSTGEDTSERDCMDAAPGAIRVRRGSCPAPTEGRGCASVTSVMVTGMVGGYAVDAFGRWRKAPRSLPGTKDAAAE